MRGHHLQVCKYHLHLLEMGMYIMYIMYESGRRLQVEVGTYVELPKVRHFAGLPIGPIPDMYASSFCLVLVVPTEYLPTVQ